MIKIIKLVVIGVVFLFNISLAFAATELQEEGAKVGFVSRLDCVGAGITCTASGIKGTVTVPGGAGSGDLLADGSIPMTADWEFGNYDLTLKSLTGDGDLSFKRTLNTPVGTTSITAAANTIASANTLYNISSDADYLMTSTPTITAGADGQWLILRNTGSFIINLQDNAILVGSDIFHGGSNGILNPSEVMTLLYTASNGGGWDIQSNPNTQVSASADAIVIRASEALASALLPVYVSGYNVGLSLLTVGIADQDDSAKMPAIGVTISAISNNATGLVVTNGVIDNVNTSSFSVGDSLYVSNSGTLVNTKPTLDDIQAIAIVSRSNVSTGSVMVIGAGRANDVPRVGTMTTLGVDELNLDDGEFIEWGTDENITFDGTRNAFKASDDLYLYSLNPQHVWWDTRDDTAYSIHYDQAATYPFALWYGDVGASGFNIGNSGWPIWYVDSSRDLKIPKSDVTIGGTLTFTGVGKIGAYLPYRGAYGSLDPVATDDIPDIDYMDKAVTITRVQCYSDQTVVINLQRDDGSAANMLTADVTCDSVGGHACASGCDTTLVDAEDNVAATNRIDLVTDSVSGTPTRFSLFWFGTYD